MNLNKFSLSLASFSRCWFSVYQFQKTRALPASLDFFRRLFNSIRREHSLLFLALLIVAFQCAIALLVSRFFFNSDSIYFLSPNRKVQGLRDVWGTLIQLDDRENFRPFTFWISSSLLVPLGGLHPWVYSMLSAFMHALNTLLCGLMVWRLTQNRVIAVLSSFFFGMHWVLFHVTYGMVCLPDLCYVFFSFVAVLAFLRYMESNSPFWKLISLGACLFAFFSKEMAVILPVLMWVLSWIQIGRVYPRPAAHQRFIQAIEHTQLYWGLTALFLIHFWILGRGSILPTKPEHPSAVEVSAQQLLEKTPYFWWVMNLPQVYDRSKGPSEVMQAQARYISPHAADKVSRTLFSAEGVYFWVGIALWSPVVLWAIVHSFRTPEVRRFLPFCLALLLSLTPVFLLARKIMPHNIYLATAGMAFWMALCLGTVQLTKARWGGLREWALFAYFVATLVGIYNEVNRSWQIHGSIMAQTAVDDLKHILPELAPTAGLYFLKSTEGGLPWYYDGGNLFRAMFQKPRLWVRFQDRNDYFPKELRLGSKDYILRVVGTHIYDASSEFLVNPERTAESLLPLFDISAVAINRQEYYPRYDKFNTPNEKLAFIMPVHRFNVGYQALVLLAGGAVEAYLEANQQPGYLVVRVCLVNDFGDGVVGRLTAIDDRGDKVLIEHEFLPVEKLEEGSPFRLKLETFNRWGRDTIGDWLAWSIIRVPSAQETQNAK
jgi:hypothetical protein